MAQLQQASAEIKQEQLKYFEANWNDDVKSYQSSTDGKKILAPILQIQNDIL
jgi:hypothetical protein